MDLPLGSGAAQRVLVDSASEHIASIEDCQQDEGEPSPTTVLAAAKDERLFGAFPRAIPVPSTCTPTARSQPSSPMAEGPFARAALLEDAVARVVAVFAWPLTSVIDACAVLQIDRDETIRVIHEHQLLRTFSQVPAHSRNVRSG
jgi:hypothetical protein